MARRTVIVAGAVALVGMVALTPCPAHAAGPTKICYDSAEIDQKTVDPDTAVIFTFPYSGAYMFTAQYIQNGNFGTFTELADWWGQDSSVGIVEVGSTNYAGAPITTSGWMVETWQCS